MTVPRGAADGQRPVTVGLYFSLGHSTIVFILSLLVALATSWLKGNVTKFQTYGPPQPWPPPPPMPILPAVRRLSLPWEGKGAVGSHLAAAAAPPPSAAPPLPAGSVRSFIVLPSTTSGAIIGTSISAGFLLLIGLLNLWVRPHRVAPPSLLAAAAPRPQSCACGQPLLLLKQRPQVLIGLLKRWRALRLTAAKPSRTAAQLDLPGEEAPGSPTSMPMRSVDAAPPPPPPPPVPSRRAL